MGALITDEYRKQNRLLHETSARYGAHGARHADQVDKICTKYECGTILDYGAGKRTLGTALRQMGRHCQDYDPAVPGIDNRFDVLPHHLVTCCDVLEHIEPECLTAILKDLHYLSAKALYFVIACRPSSNRLPDGSNAHKLINPPEWWIEQLERYFGIIEFNRTDGELSGIAIPHRQIGHIEVTAAVDDSVRADQVSSNCAFFTNRLTPPYFKGSSLEPHGRTALLACYGPSLQTTWPVLALRGPADDLFSVSAAYRFLRDRKQTPLAHMDADPRAHKALQIGDIGPDTEFWLASCVHPIWQEKVPAHRVKLWHAYNGGEQTKAVEECDPGRGQICGGGSIGLRAICLLYFLGYRRIVVHGLDSSFAADGAQWAGEHLGKIKAPMEVICKGRKFITSAGMIAYARYFGKMIEILPGCQIELAGDGLLQTMYRPE